MAETPPTPDQSNARWPLAGVLAFVTLAYLVNYNGLWSSNDGSHFALVRAICERGSFELGPNSRRYTHNMDFARSPRGGIYSDRPPGAALLVAPVYALGYWGARAFGRTLTETALCLLAGLWVGVFAVVNVALVYWGARRLGAGTRAALAGAVVFAFAGLAYRYSTLLFSHTPSVTATLLGACLLLGPAPRKRRRLAYPAIGFVMGYAVVIEYQDAVFSAIYFAIWAARLARRRDWRAIALIALGAAVPAVFLAWYHYVCFGSPWRSTHSFNPLMPHNLRFGSIFAGRFVDGAEAIFIRPKMGILVNAPIFVFGLAGLLWAARRRAVMAWAVVAAAGVYTFIIAHHVTIAGGSSQDCRYFFPAASLLALGFGPCLTWFGCQSRPLLRRGLLGIFAAVALYSMVMSTYRMVRAKITVGTHLLPAEDFVLGWFTLPSPDSNVDRLNLTLFIMGPLIKQGKRGEALEAARAFYRSAPSVWNRGFLDTAESLLGPSRASIAQPDSSPANPAAPPAPGPPPPRRTP